MKLSFNNGVIGLAIETEAERAVCAALLAADRYVFRLHCSTDRGFALVELGPEEDACRAALNITQSVAPNFAPISNLAHTPFVLDGMRYASVEGFWQGLKFEEAVERRRIAKLWGSEAKDAGKPAGQPDRFTYGPDRIAAGSPEHWHLMRRACAEKFDQHAGARAALLETGARWLTHKTRRDSRTIPGAILAQIWMDLRDRLRS